MVCLAEVLEALMGIQGAQCYNMWIARDELSGVPLPAAVLIQACLAGKLPGCFFHAALRWLGTPAGLWVLPASRGYVSSESLVWRVLR